MSGAAWTLTTRSGSQVDHQHLETLEEALAALDRRLEELAPEAHLDEARFLSRRIEPVRLVAARLEIAGPGARGRTVRAGVDLRGDGSVEAFTGRVRRAVLERREGESAADALRRALRPAPAT